MSDRTQARLRRLPGALLAFVALGAGACGGSSASTDHDAGVQREAGGGHDVTTGDDARGVGDAPADTHGVKKDATSGADVSEKLDANDAGGPTPTTDGGSKTCNALATSGPPITATFIAAAGPSAAGGAIVPGTYLLSSFAMYTGAGGESGNAAGALLGAAQITSGSIESVSENLSVQPDGGATEVVEVVSESGTFTTNGDAITVSFTCPGVATGTQSYTATPTSFAFFETEPTDGGAVVVVTTYAKQ
jgi:hypothetical protein